ncbi:MAG: Asp-tRNA(Asn)/Glu-tRNA(Gln) amidotransferase subunit GatB [bacterium]|nr:Asp-tRNA(Asn)/Glu-tRNA(Gln) amidotransferase subunit GatB [bacterium]
MTSPFDLYEVVIGLECHVQLLTNTKLFSPAKNQYGDAPNENVDVIDIALPGVLPVINTKAVDFALRLGHALNCHIPKTSVFSRKHYFYPDLPKGYQISQFDKPICGEGKLDFTLDGQNLSIGIERIHIEEDAGKNIHVENGNVSYVDYNRAGTPLLEVVTRPDMRSAQEAMEVFKTIRSLATFLEICDGNMQEGSLRADVNVSVRKKGASKLGTRTETKNLNSIKFLGQAVEFEMHRQILELEAGRSIIQETRLWDSARKESRSLRSKEEAHDYRYFPDPDLLPLNLTPEKIDTIKTNLPELPRQKAKRYCKDLGLSEYDAQVLTADREVAKYFESALGFHNNAKGIANWIINDILRIVKVAGNEEDNISLDASPIDSKQIAELVKLIDDKIISSKIAKQVFEEMLAAPGKAPLTIVDDKSLRVEKDEAFLQNAVTKVLSDNPDEVTKFLSGKTQMLGYLMGQVMKLTAGKVDPKEAKDLLLKLLEKTT